MVICNCTQPCCKLGGPYSYPPEYLNLGIAYVYKHISGNLDNEVLIITIIGIRYYRVVSLSSTVAYTVTLSQKYLLCTYIM